MFFFYLKYPQDSNCIKRENICFFNLIKLCVCVHVNPKLRAQVLSENINRFKLKLSVKGENIFNYI